MRTLPWPEASFEQHLKKLEAPLSLETSGTLPLVILVAQHGGEALVGFLEVGLRSHADGCDPAQPVDFVEGWFVDEAFRVRRAAWKWRPIPGLIIRSRSALIKRSASNSWISV